MLVKCVFNRGWEIPEYQRARGESERSEYPVVPGWEYLVLGMLIWERALSLLVAVDEVNRPHYVPAALFDLGTLDIPSGWKFGIYSGIRASGTDLWADGRVAKWGYPELVDDERHGGGLMDGDPDALAIFARRVAEMRELHGMSKRGRRT